MLKISIDSQELYDNAKDEFIYTKPTELILEHSLVSLSKWEAKWKRPFLTKETKTREETLDYIRHMTITKNVNEDVYNHLNQKTIGLIVDYIDDPMTATTFRELKSTPNREIVTSELIYYWMIMFQIPFECQKWHLNRLLTLIKVCNIKNQKPSKRSKADVGKEIRELNAARKTKLNTNG